MTWRVVQRRRFRELNDLARVHHRDLVGHPFDSTQIMADENNGDPAGSLQVLEQVRDREADNGIEGGRDLIANQDRGLCRQGPGKIDTLLLAAGQLAGPAIGQSGIELDALQ